MRLSTKVQVGEDRGLADYSSNCNASGVQCGGGNIGGLGMGRSARLPARFPVGSKYVLEAGGTFVERYVEFPNGRKVRLSRRKALPCECWELQQVSIVPDRRTAPIDAPTSKKRERVST
jgi:hypothetical protein